MKNLYLLALALLASTQVIAADKDSVYAWGAWSQNIQPAAGPAATVTPSPVAQPNVNFRQNENPAFNRIDLAAQANAQAAADAAAQAAAEAAAQAAAEAAAALAQAAAIAAQQAHTIPNTTTTTTSSTGPATGGF